MTQQYEKLFLIKKLMESYQLEYNIQDENWLGEKFNNLYELPPATLYNLIKIRGIKLTNKVPA